MGPQGALFVVDASPLGETVLIALPVEFGIHGSISFIVIMVV